MKQCQSYNGAISACEKGGQWQEALSLFEAMPKAKIRPDVISCSAAISVILFESMDGSRVDCSTAHAILCLVAGKSIARRVFQDLFFSRACFKP